MSGPCLQLFTPKLSYSRETSVPRNDFIPFGVTYHALPADIIRKRLVVDTSLPQRQYKGFADCVAKTWQREGIRGFYRFYGYDMLLRFGGGILLVMYDEVKHLRP